MSIDERQGKKICLFGPQGSGKGTQAERLIDTYGVPHLSPGNIFRKAIADQTELGQKVKSILDAGELVPNEVTNAIMKERLEQEDALDGFVLDGYPRNENQAEALDGVTSLSHVFVIDISDDESVNRISRRRVCLECGSTYHLDFKPSKEEGVCDEDGKELVQRDDDKPEAIKKRLEIYHAETKPLLDRYEERGILFRIDGMQSIEKVWEDVQEALLG